ncbi:hypothetical protein [uncultured Microscilla sp.]|uniref:hypothetical protein n=1 Tax=uncultured Microscilla sp. TaxID=432653 RepID=UPI002609DF9F|nr:hypothetical protein [uncultured Microscilla sp.]
MTKLRVVLMSVLLLAGTGIGYAQSSNLSHKKALEIQQRTLLVPIAAKKSKNDEVFEQLVKKYWKFNEQVEFVSHKKAAAMLKKNKGKYALLGYSLFVDRTTTRRRNPAYNGMNSKYNKDSYVSNTIQTLVVWLTDKKGSIKVNLSRKYSLERNTIYGLQHLQYLLNYLVADSKHKSLMTFYKRQIKKNAPELKQKTLLIDEKLLAKKLKRAKIKDYYPYPHKIVKTGAVEQALKEQNADYAFIHIASIDYGQGAMNIHFVSNAATGKIYLYLAAKVGMPSIAGIKLHNNRNIGKKQLKKYAKRLK